MHPDEPRFILFAQVHYPQIWSQMVRQLDEAIAVPYALFISCHDAEADLALPRSPCLRSVERIATENRGRDVLPFLTSLRDRKDRPYPDIALKLHTKKSPHREDGLGWRDYLVLSLLEAAADDPSMPAALRLMEAEPRIGLVAPRHHLLPVKGRIGGNRPHMKRMAGQLGLDLNAALTTKARFPAGSMFWFRRSAVESLARAPLGDLFEPEMGKLDATMAHAMERLFALAAGANGSVALPMEAVPAVEGLVSRNGGAVPLEAIEREIARSEAYRSNPFLNPLPWLIERYDILLVASHFLSQKLPKPLWKTGRAAAKGVLGVMDAMLGRRRSK